MKPANSSSIFQYFFVCYFAFCLLIGHGQQTLSAELDSLPNLTWKLMGPGDADQVTSLSVMPSGKVFLGSDIGGLYYSDDEGESWRSSNQGILNPDVTTRIISKPGDETTLFVGTRGGLYKSTNGGGIWYNVRSGLLAKQKFSLSGSIGAIAMDAKNPSTVYLGYGYRPSFDGNSTVQKIEWSKSLYKSRDSGENWQPIQVFETPAIVYQIQIDSVGRVYVASSNGLYISDSSATKWHRAYHESVYSLLFFNTGFDRLLISVGASGVKESMDGGITWSSLNKGLGFASGTNRYSVLAKSTDESRVFVLNSTWDRSGGIYRKDGVSDWTLLSAELPRSWLSTSRRFNDLAITGEGVVYAGTSRYVYRSRKWGNGWEQLISRKESGGWVHRGLNIFGHTTDFVVNPETSSEFFIATFDHGITYSTNSGSSWNELKSNLIYGGYVADLEYCKDASLTRMYATTQESAYGGRSCISVSSDAGKNWEKKCSAIDDSWDLTKVFSSAGDCNLLMLAAKQGLLRSVNGGADWLRPNFSEAPGKVYDITAAGSEFKVAYLGAENGLFRSDDKGLNWHKIAVSGLQAPVTSVSIVGADEEILLFGTLNGQFGPGAIYRTSDEGVTWDIVLDGLRKYVSAIRALPANPTIIYAATNDDNYHDESSGSGIFRSDDAGETWELAMNGLPVKRAGNLSVDLAQPSRIFLAASGSGVYVLNEGSSTADNPPNPPIITTSK